MILVRDVVYDQPLGVVICSKAYKYVLIALMWLYEEFDIFRVTFDFHILVYLSQSEKQIRFYQILNSFRLKEYKIQLNRICFSDWDK